MDEHEYYDIVAEAEAILADDSNGIGMVDAEELIRAGRQAIKRLGRNITEDEFYTIALELNRMRLTSILLKLWEDGELFVGGFRNDEIVWYSDET